MRYMSVSEKNAKQAPAVVKEKNLKIVEAGKKLTERNRKYKEHFEKIGGGDAVTSQSSTLTAVSGSVKGENNSTYFVIGIIILGAAGLMYYQSRQQKPVAVNPKPKIVVEEPKPKTVVAKLLKPNRLINM